MNAGRVSISSALTPNRRQLIPAIVLTWILLLGIASCTPAEPPAASTPAAGEPVELAAAGAEGVAAIAREIRPRLEGEDLVTLHWSLEGEPGSVDPALASDQAALDATVNLFVGLTRYDPETLEVLPYLATEWEVSEDGLVYTFYLRDDVQWVRSDPATGFAQAQRPVTAHDVEYGIKRSLDPDTGSHYAYVLSIIRNAAAARLGAPLEEVGVWALDDITVEFTLEEPASYFPAIVALWVAKPQPQEPIEEHGEDWTEPASIWTNGPYLLTEWTPETSLRFEKNPFWIHSEQVQIEVVEAMMVIDVSTGLALYGEDELDSARVPLAELPAVLQDPELNRQLVRQPVPCTDYYGFTTTKPPFDDLRVRTAFSAAIDRAALIEIVLENGGEIPATSFAPPGTWGAPAPGEVGLGYDPELARAAFQEYLDETGLEDAAAFEARYHIMLGYNTGERHARVAAAVQEMWASALGVNVTVADQDWTAHLEATNRTTPVEEAFHIFRMGWCADYPDENNWLREVFHYQEGANRVRRRCADPDCAGFSGPAVFDRLVIEAAREPDPTLRRELYARAEDILAREEVVAAFLFHGGANYVTKPWLHRDHASADGAHWYAWTIDWGVKKAAR